MNYITSIEKEPIFATQNRVIKTKRKYFVLSETSGICKEDLKYKKRKIEEGDYILITETDYPDRYYSKGKFTDPALDMVRPIRNDWIAYNENYSQPSKTKKKVNKLFIIATIIFFALLSISFAGATFHSQISYHCQLQEMQYQAEMLGYYMEDVVMLVNNKIRMDNNNRMCIICALLIPFVLLIMYLPIATKPNKGETK